MSRARRVVGAFGAAAAAPNRSRWSGAFGAKSNLMSVSRREWSDRARDRCLAYDERQSLRRSVSPPCSTRISHLVEVVVAHVARFAPLRSPAPRPVLGQSRAAVVSVQWSLYGPDDLGGGALPLPLPRPPAIGAPHAFGQRVVTIVVVDH